MKNIGFITTWFESGAAYVSRQYIQLLEPEHKVFVFARAGKRADKKDGRWGMGDNITYNREDLLITTYINKRRFLRWIRENKIEVVFFNEQQWWEPLKWCMELGIRTGAYVDYYTEQTIPLFAAYDFLICNTKRHQSAFDWHPQCHYVPWGTDINLFETKENGNWKSENSNWKSEKVTFFHSCGVDPLRKGTDILIEAFYKVVQSDECKVQNAKRKVQNEDCLLPSAFCLLVIHTQVSLETQFPQLSDKIRQLTSAGKLEIIHKTVGAPGLYHLGDVYVYPSRLEGIGLTIAEALSSGLPVIVPDNPPMNEFTEEGVNGRLVRVQRLHARWDGYYWPLCITDAGHLAEVMEEMVSDREKLENMKLAARRYALEHLDWSKNKSQVVDAFINSSPIPHPPSLFQQIDRFQKFGFNKVYYYAYKLRLLTKPLSKAYTAFKKRQMGDGRWKMGDGG
jgi:glycosyltransferase involved in cell wall biosynthesis